MSHEYTEAGSCRGLWALLRLLHLILIEMGCSQSSGGGEPRLGVPFEMAVLAVVCWGLGWRRGDVGPGKPLAASHRSPRGR